MAVNLIPCPRLHSVVTAFAPCLCSGNERCNDMLVLSRPAEFPSEEDGREPDSIPSFALRQD
eukprot:11168872-Lingulodinium_polyedra.AAC.1